MRIHAIEVTDFRRIARCRVSLGAGLNVLHGPNEIGKSSLAEAVRAALLTPPGVAIAASYRPWGSDAIPEVRIEFEHGDVRWRLHKRFATGTQSRAFLERVTASGAVVEEARGRAVDGKIRELLAWGLPAPGGKGRARDPSTFLTVALLGSQGQTAAILDKDLEADGDTSGRELITKALDALGQDPLVRRILEQVDEKVATAYTETGQMRRSADSPLVRSRDKLSGLESELGELDKKLQESREVQAEVRRLRAESDRALAERDEAQHRLEALEDRQRRSADRRRYEETMARAVSGLECVEAHERKVTELSAKLRELDRRCAESQAAVAEAGAACERREAIQAEALRRSQEARSAVETAVVVARETWERRRLELAREREEAERLAGDARRAADGKARAAGLRQEVAALERRAREAEAAERRVALRSLHADVVERLAGARAACDAAARAARALEAALREEEQAAEALRSADQRLIEAEGALRRHVEEHDSARRRLIEIERDEQKVREQLERRLAIDARREALRGASLAQGELDGRVSALRASSEECSRAGDAALEGVRAFEGVRRFRELSKLRQRLAGFDERRSRSQRLAADRDRLRREAATLSREADARHPRSPEALTRGRPVSTEAGRSTNGEASTSLAPLLLKSVAAGVVVGALAFAISGALLGFGTTAASLGAAIGVITCLIAGFTLHRRGSELLRESLRQEARVRGAEVERLDVEIRELFVVPDTAEDTKRKAQDLEGELAGVPADVLERTSREAGDDAQVIREIQGARRAVEEYESKREEIRDELARVEASRQASVAQIESATRELSAQMEAADGAADDASGAVGRADTLREELARLRADRERVRGPASPASASASARGETILAESRAARDEAAAVRRTCEEHVLTARKQTVDARVRAEAAAAATRGLDVDALASEEATARAVLAEALSGSARGPVAVEASGAIAVGVAAHSTTAASTGAGNSEVGHAVASALDRRDVAGGTNAFIEAEPEAPGSPGSEVASARSVHGDIRASLEAKRALAGDEEARVAALVEALGRTPEEALGDAEARLAAAKAELDALINPSSETTAAPAVGAEEAAVAAAKEALEQARGQREAATAFHTSERTSRDIVQGKLESVSRNAPDRPLAEAALAEAREALARLDPVEVASDDVVTEANALRDACAQAFAEADGRLRNEQGKLELVGGAVLEERRRETYERLERLRQEHGERELSLEGYRLLAAVLKRHDADQSTHLGRALAKPVTERFIGLVGGHYSDVRIGPTLRPEGVEAAGERRDLEVLSVGTRDQLATLIRLAIAEHLKTALLLDDQLTQTDSSRMGRLRETLRAAARSGTQILVLTCRPADYLNPDELAGDGPASGIGKVSSIDLSRVLTQRNAGADPPRSERDRKLLRGFVKGCFVTIGFGTVRETGGRHRK